MLNLNDLAGTDALKIHLADGEEIKSWSFGKVTKPETINYRTFKPERDGLFDEKIFGPVADYKCACGKYNGYRYKGVICDKCGVEVTRAKVRRERMGHIELAAPVAHIWYFKGIPSRIATLMEISPKSLEAVIYFSSYILMEVDHDKKAEVISEIEEEIKQAPEVRKKEIEEEITEIEKEYEELLKTIDEKDEKKLAKKQKNLRSKTDKKIKRLNDRLPKEQMRAEKKMFRIKKKIQSMELNSIMTDSEYFSMRGYIEKFAKVGIGAEAISEMLENLDLTALASDLKQKSETAKGQVLVKVSKRLKMVEGFRRAGVKPSSMILSAIPVIPPELRPMVQLDGGRFATSDLNDLYRRVINRNNRLKKLLSIGAPSIITRNEKRMLQEAVDALIDSSKSRRSNRLNRGKKQLKSLSDMIKGKQGRFRQNLLGKRVDFSGRAVIVAGPDLKIDQCGLPKKMALELYKPFVYKELLMRGLAPNIKTARIMVSDEESAVFDVLEEVVKKRPVLLNRAPTLHRLGIQGFYPKLVEGYAIRVHPLVCVGFNADFDGDQMAVHLPLSEESLKEINDKIMSTNNFLKPSDGEFIALASRDMYLGTYFLTYMPSDKPKYDKLYTEKEALQAYQNEKLLVNDPINVITKDGQMVSSVGRLIMNKVFPEDYPFISSVLDRSAFKDIAIDIHKKYGNKTVAKFLDDAKDLGFKYATLSGLSVSITDVEMVKDREKIIKEAEDKITQIEDNYYKGLITKDELKSLSHNVWIEATDTLDVKTWSNLSKDNTLKVMVTAGAGKASRAQIKQIGGMKGLVQDANGNLVDLPIRNNYRLGLTGFECFNASRGARKGLTDKGLKTADAGYLTRRLVDVAQDTAITEEDCGSVVGRVVKKEDTTPLSEFKDRIWGRYLVEDLKDSKGKVIASKDEVITKDIAAKIQDSGVEEVEIRSPLTCKTNYGLCKKCYGIDLSTLKSVKIGEAVGVIAAQSIGEPGTQLTMKTFHAGGIAGKDITMGLPRVEEIFEARSPKSLSIMAEISGKVKITELETGEIEIKVTSLDKKAEIPEVKYTVDPTSEIVVNDGQLVTPGEELTLGYLDLKELFALKGIRETQRYIIDQIQKVYSSQGVPLDDKHIEIVVSKMFNKVQIISGGDSDFLPGEITTKDNFEESNKRVVAEGGTPAQARVILLGISKSSLNTDSFLSAASFQETTRILSEAACSGQVDKLRGLKENVIVGKLIPVGTGYTGKKLKKKKGK